MKEIRWDRRLEDEIDLHDIFLILWRSRLLIISISMIAVLLGGAISFAMPSIYRASCTVALGNFSDPIYTTETMAEEFLLSDELLLDVIEELNLDVPPNKFKAFKEEIKIEHVCDDVLAISIETQDQQNSTKIIKKMAELFVNRSEESYNKYKNILSNNLAITQENLAVLDSDINQTREVLRNIDTMPGISQEQLELTHSRMLEYLQNEESRHVALQDQYIQLRRQLEFMENTRVLMMSGEPLAPIKPQRTLIMAVAGMLGLMVGLFASFLREGLRKRTE